jgi:hypothetical protein
MASSAVSGIGSLPQSLQLPAAQIQMQRKVTDIEAQGALQLIQQSAAPMNASSDVGQMLNILA